MNYLFARMIDGGEESDDVYAMTRMKTDANHLQIDDCSKGNERGFKVE